MRIAFDIHNELGRLHDEKIYQIEMAERCRDAGFRVRKEAPLSVSHEGFSKTYLADLVVDDSIVYELKTADALSSQHRQQTLNYLFLAGFQYGKLVNMRPPSVQSEYVSTTLTPAERYRFEIINDGWMDLDADSVWLREQITSLLRDWGAFLDVNLFSEAISYFRGGDELFVRPVEIKSNGRVLGTQKVPLLTPEIAISLSAVRDSEASYEQHLRRFLDHTSLDAVHWTNFNRHRILMKTLTK